MSKTRRQLLVGASLGPIVVPRMLAEISQQVGEPQPAPDAQFTPPPAALTDEELQLLARSVESARSASVSELVQDARFSQLHPQPVFRQLVRAVARDSVLSIPAKDEPGTPIVATGLIEDSAGHPVRGAVVYVYHTSAKGWYSDKAAHIRAWSGDARHARLFGYLKTGPEGSFEIRTIRPGGYPRSSLPQHIHFEVECEGFNPLATELLFDDDPRLTAEQRRRAGREGFIIAASSSGPQHPPRFPLHRRAQEVLTKEQPLRSIAEHPRSSLLSRSPPRSTSSAPRPAAIDTTTSDNLQRKETPADDGSPVG